MRPKTLSCSTVIAISLIMLFAGVLFTHAQQRPYIPPVPKREQQKKKKKEDTPKEHVPLYNGSYVGVDIYGLGNRLLGSDFLSSEISATINLKKRYLPVLEVGYGTTNTINDLNIHYKSAAPYLRLGIDYNVMAKKKDKNSFLYLGMRYGACIMKYDISSTPVEDSAAGTIINPNLRDDIWGGSIAGNFTGEKGSLQWFELLLGVRAQIYKNFHMGWTVRMKYKITASTGEHGNPWYVPGYGKYGSKSMGLTYSLIYKLPL